MILKESPRFNRTSGISIILLILVVFFVLGLRKTGKLQYLNFKGYGQFVHWQGSATPVSNKIVILEITESDIASEELGGWPMPDETLHRVLENLLSYQPRVIAIDLFRDRPVPYQREGVNRLSTVFRENDNIIAINKVGKNRRSSIREPLALRDRPEQVGFSDLPIDSSIDNVVRRALLFMDDGKQIFYSFALRISLKFLFAKGIFMEADKEISEFLRLGKKTIYPLEENDGAYVNLDSRGYQILIDYSGPRKFSTISMRDVLSKKVEEKVLKDKIVLIGVNAMSLKDFHMTPVDLRTPGVYIHGMIINQLLTGSLEGKTSLQFLSDWQEILWILSWCFLGGIIGTCVFSPLLFLLVIIIGIVVLVSVAFMVFLQGLWIPIAGSVLTFGIGSLVVNISNHYFHTKAYALKLRESRDQLREYNRTLESRVKSRTEDLNRKNIELTDTLNKLKQAQDQMVTQEKLASLGTLTAGIAHELKNPLNFVNNFAQLSVELSHEVRQEIKHVVPNEKSEAVLEIENLLDDLVTNSEKINVHGQRADSIVTSMLGHSQNKVGTKILSEFHSLLDQYLKFAQHTSSGNSLDFRMSIQRRYDSSIGKVELYQQEIGRVILNLFTNAIYSMKKKKEQLGVSYSPELYVSTKKLPNKIELRIRDNGEGIPLDIREKILTPFFTTKPAGEGVGLGLSISYEIIHSLHKGSMEFESEYGEFTEFILSLPT